MVTEINIVIDQYIGFLKDGSLIFVKTFGFENGKEVFCHCVVITAAAGNTKELTYSGYCIASSVH